MQHVLKDLKRNTAEASHVWNGYHWWTKTCLLCQHVHMWLHCVCV